MDRELIGNRWLAVINPNSGGRKCERDWNKISGLLDKQNIDYHAVFTQRRNHAIELVRDHIEQGYRKVVSIGGDGTLNEIVNGVFRQKTVPTTDITLGVVSVGTGNDWGRTFHIPADYAGAIELLRKEDTFVQDAGMVSFDAKADIKARYFINMAGLGYDGLVAQKTNADKELGKANPLVYFKNIFSALFSYKSQPTRIIIDGVEMHHNLFSLNIGIGRFNGGGMIQAPNALPDDGLFDLTIYKHMSKWSVVANVNRLYNGTIGQHKKVELHTGRNIIIDPRNPILLEVDGESLGVSPFTFTLIPGCLKVVVNREKMTK